MSRCRQICRHIKMLTYIYICQHVEISARSTMPTYSDGDIYANILSWWHKCRHIEMRKYSSSRGEYADIYFNTHNFRILTNMPTYADADIYGNILRCWHMPTYVGIMCRYLDCESCCNMGSANHKPRYIHGGHKMHVGRAIGCGCLVTWSSVDWKNQDNKTTAPPWPYPYETSVIGWANSELTWGLENKPKVWISAQRYTDIHEQIYTRWGKGTIFISL